MLDIDYLACKPDTPVGIARKLCVWLAFSCNLAWVIIATQVGLTLILKASLPDLPSGSEDDWGIGVVCVSTTICSVVAFVRNDLAYTIVTAWALFGIYQGLYDPPQKACIIGLAVAVSTFLLGLVNHAFQQHFSPNCHVNNARLREALMPADSGAV